MQLPKQHDNGGVHRTTSVKNSKCLHSWRQLKGFSYDPEGFICTRCDTYLGINLQGYCNRWQILYYKFGSNVIGQKQSCLCET